MVCIFLSLLKRKLPHRCPKQGGGVKATFGQCPKGSSFFLGMTSLMEREVFFYKACLYCLLYQAEYEEEEKNILLKRVIGNTIVNVIRCLVLRTVQSHQERKKELNKKIISSCPLMQFS